MIKGLRKSARNRGARAVIFALFFAAACPAFLFADSITGSWQQAPDVPQIPGAPVDFYFWSTDGPFGSDPFDDAGFNSFINTPGAFLSTGNTAFNYNGTSQILLGSTVTSGTRTQSLSSTGGVTPVGASNAAVPEPATMFLTGLGLLALGSYRGLRARRFNSSLS